MRTVILVPRRADGGRRDELWAWVRSWLERNHPEWEIVEGASPEGPFNRGAAINQAARDAGQWDVAVVHDADNFASPAKLRLAVERAHSGVTQVAHSTYQYLGQEASEEILQNPDGPWWPDLQLLDANPATDSKGYNRYNRHKHVSGIVAVPRRVWEVTDGFVELTGWGSEDSLHLVMCNALGGGVEWVSGSCYHLWHEHAGEDTTKDIRSKNRQEMLAAKRFERRGDIAGLKAYLAELGHPVP